MNRKIIFYLVTIAAIVLVYAKISELKLLQDFFTPSNAGFLALVLAIQFFSYLFQAVNYQVVLKIKGLRVSVRELFPISFIVQFISQAVPTAGISGQIFFISYLKKYSLTIAEGIGRAILELATLYVGYTVFFVTSAILLFRKDVFHQDHRFVYFMYAFLIFIFICVVIFLLSQKKKRAGKAHWLYERFSKYIKKSWLKEVPDLSFKTIKEQFRATLGWDNIKTHFWLFVSASLWQVVLLSMHVLTLYAIGISFGEKINLAACIVAFTFAKFVSMLSVVPGAPGVFEGIMTLILISFGVDKGVAFSATLLTRAFTFWLPMPIGWFLYARHTRRMEIDDKTVTV